MSIVNIHDLAGKDGQPLWNVIDKMLRKKSKLCQLKKEQRKEKILHHHPSATQSVKGKKKHARHKP